MASTRTERHPENWQCVTEWGWTHLPWPEFVKRFPKQAKAFAQNHTEGWAPEEIKEMGGRNVLKWPALDDDEPFVTKDGQPIIYANVDGPGGSLFLSYQNGEWDEVLVDDDGNLETLD